MNKKINVLNVMEDGRIAGPQLRMLRVAVALRSSVNTIVAIPTDGPYDFRDALSENNVNYVQLPLTKLSRKPLDIALSLMRMPGEILGLSAAIKKHEIDLVHSSGGAWMFKAIIAGSLSKVPTVWHLNDTSSPSVFRQLARFLLRKRVAGVIVAGSRVKTHYLPDFNEGYADKLELMLIEAPVDTKVFLPAENQTSSDHVKIATVGNISPVKGYQTLLTAASLLRSSDRVVWNVVGSRLSSQNKYIAKIAQEMKDLGLSNVAFQGACSDVSGMLAEQDIYVCTSDAEASPTSVWEAMSSGLPVVATDVGSVSDYITHGENGFIVPVGDAAGLARYIDQLAENPDLRQRMGRKNRIVAVENLDLSICADRHLSIYTKVCGNLGL